MDEIKPANRRRVKSVTMVLQWKFFAPNPMILWNMSHPGNAQGQPIPHQGHFLLPSKMDYTTGGCPTAQRGCPMALGDWPTAPTAYPASGRAYPMVPCVPSKLTHATERIQPASKGVNVVNVGVFVLWVWLKEHRLSFKVLPLEIGDRRSPNQNISDIAWYRTDTGGNMRRIWLKEFRKSERISWLKERQSQTL